MKLAFLMQIEKRLLSFSLVVLLLEYLLFQTYFTVNMVPYYPKNYDQLTTYNAIYEAYFSTRDHGLLATLRPNTGISQWAFKGWTVPSLGLVATFMFGPSRSSIALVNFFFFVCGQLILWRFVYRRHGFSSAVLAWGLYLLGGTHYFWAGGLDDLRLDYAGMVTFGTSFLCLVSLIENPERRKLWLCLLAFGVSLFTRSITMIYLLGTQAILVFLFGLRRFMGRLSEEDKHRLKYLIVLFIGSLAEFGGFLVMLWHQFHGYYVKLLLTDEKIIRDSEWGVRTVLDRLIYYPRSSLDHFLSYALVIGAFVIYFLFQWIRLRLARTQLAPRLTNQKTSLSLTVFMATALSTYAILTTYSQSPVVIGVLTIPLVFVVTILLVEGFTLLKCTTHISSAAFVIAVMGVMNYANAMIAPKFIGAFHRSEGKVVNELFHDLKQVAETHQSSALTTYWMLNHPGFIDGAFNVYLYENRSEDLVPTLQHINSTIFAVTGTELLSNLKSAKIVIAYSEMPPAFGFEFPFTMSLRHLQSIWKQYLQREFLQRQTYSVSAGQGRIGLYIRPVRVVAYKVPNSLEYSNGRPFFWLGNEKAEIKIDNSDNKERKVVFTADSGPGPSNAEMSFRHLHYEFEGRKGVLVLGKERRWAISLRLTVKPGSNALFLHVSDKGNPSLNPNKDPRVLLLRINNIGIEGMPSFVEN